MAKRSNRVAWGLVVLATVMIPSARGAAQTDLPRSEVAQGREDTIDRLLGRTPLMRAAKESDTAAVKALLAEDAGVNAGDKNGMTALMWAGIPEVALLLLAGGASPNIRDGFGRTALCYAAFRGDASQARMLLSQGLPANDKDEDGLTPLYFALYGEDCIGFRTGQWPMKETVLSFLPEARDRDSGESVIQLLLSRGANVNARDNKGRTPLIFFAQHHIVQTHKAHVGRQLGYLLNKGADVNAADAEGHTALMWRACHGDVSMVEILLKHGADARARTVNGETALSLASKMPAGGVKPQVKALLLAAARTPAGPRTSTRSGKGR